MVKSKSYRESLNLSKQYKERYMDLFEKTNINLKLSILFGRNVSSICRWFKTEGVPMYVRTTLECLEKSSNEQKELTRNQIESAIRRTKLPNLPKSRRKKSKEAVREAKL